ncbi:radical SAM family heme chaperone HemW [Curvivirga aplysinae]|uniref:radical SAM family heme chaperone HemW n=1 Tax=Curvivirga aplysinae TaxID=2529852 RepID=UPI0012BC7417|nr:radical SAM family heme chaperone HemW [Curvivirga aplysinae]MTI08496.1 coproporphyrinogen III oxidase [Curvivirga aplysinae]
MSDLPEIALYVHWPFCQSKCPYCDFNSHVRDQVEQDQWRQALVRELDHAVQEAGPRQLKSIFFGGGTPSLMPPETVAAIIERAKSSWQITDDLEITLEANPTSVDVGRFHGYRDAGVNRLSLGVQSLQPDVLEFLGRLHNVDQARQAIELASDLFDRYSFDLIYARPNQTIQAWREELNDALALAGDHLSLYQLTIEQGTAFYTKHRLGEFKMPDEELAAEFYEVTQEMMEASGRPSYEISNHAKPGQESRHNLVYWRYQDYAGIGPGAHGRLKIKGQKSAVLRHRLPEKWLGAVQSYGHATREVISVDLQEQFQEALLMGLRLREGVPVSRLKEIGDFLQQDRLDILCEEGLVIQSDDKILATEEGRQRLNAVLDYLLN